MAGSGPSVAIRLGMVDDGTIAATMAQTGESTDATTKRIAASFKKAYADAEGAAEAANRKFQQVQAVLGATTDTTKYVGNQDAQVKAYQGYMAQQARAAEVLRNAIDPMRVAQAAYDRELEVANTLLRTGNINQQEFAASVALSTKNLDAVRQRMAGAREEGSRYSVGQVVLQSAIRKSVDQFAAGAPASTIFAEHVETLVEVMQLYAQNAKHSEEASEGAGAGVAEMGGKVVESAEKLKGLKGAIGAAAEFLAGPWGVAVTAGVGLLSMFIPKLLETDDSAKKAAEQGLAEFERRQQSMARFIDATTGKLIEQHRALAQIAAMQLPSQIGAKGVETQGYINQAFATAREKVREGGSTRGGPKDAELSQAVYGAGSNGQALLTSINALIAKGRTDLVATRDLVAGYIGQAREALEAGRQLQGQQRDITTALGGGAVRSTATAQSQVDRLMSQTDAVSRAQQKLDDVQKQAPKIDAMISSPEKDAALKQYTADLLAARQGVEAAQKAEKDGAASAREHAKELREAARAAAEAAKELNKWQGEVAKQAAEGFKKFGEGLPAEMKSAQEGLAAGQKQRMAPGEWALHQMTAQGDQQTVSRTELATIGLSADARQRILDTVRKTIELQRNAPELDQDQVAAILAGVRAQDDLNAALQRMQGGLQEARDFASSIVDQLAQGKVNAQSIVQELIKLAALNPLKNLINGNNNLPTISSVFGSLSSIFSKPVTGNVGQFAASTPAGLIPGFATGTSYAPGGLAWVGENGPELMNLPRGSSITPAAQSRQLATAGAGRGWGGGDVHNHFSGNLLTPEWWAQIQAGDDHAAARGATGGASMAGQQLRQARRRDLNGS